MRARWIWPLVPTVLLVVCACGDRDKAEHDAGGGPADAYEMRGVYRCCAPGQGTACCAGTPQGTCFQYGGVYDACVMAGDELDGKVICAACCAGLVRVPHLVVGASVPPPMDGLPDGCDAAGAESSFVCTACGDGACGDGENVCNCPADCP
jgi:hypothetical protein